MISIPVNIVNLICEWAAVSEDEWVPFFSPKTHKLSYKVNKYNKKYIKKAETIYHTRFDINKIQGNLELHNIKTFEFQQFKYEAIVLKYIDNLYTLYIEFASEKKDTYIYRTMLDFKSNIDGVDKLTCINEKYLYLNKTIYASIFDGYIYVDNNYDIMLLYKLF